MLYRTKPHVIEATQITQAMWDGLEPLPDKVGRIPPEATPDGSSPLVIRDETNGYHAHVVKVGDYVGKSPEGFRSWSPAEFEALYGVDADLRVEIEVNGSGRPKVLMRLDGKPVGLITGIRFMLESDFRLEIDQIKLQFVEGLDVVRDRFPGVKINMLPSPAQKKEGVL